MINIENELFTEIATALRAKFSPINITGEYVKSPASFPHVSIIESDNYMTLAHLDSSDKERFATIMYEVNVYSNKTSGKKTECKNIIGVIDEMMYSMNFTRLAMTPIPNMEDATIYRITARYRAETDGTHNYRV